MENLYTFHCRDGSSDIGSWEVMIIAKSRYEANKLLSEHLLAMGRPEGYDTGITCIVNKRFEAKGVMYTNVEAR